MMAIICSARCCSGRKRCPRCGSLDVVPAIGADEWAQAATRRLPMYAPTSNDEETVLVPARLSGQKETLQGTFASIAGQQELNPACPLPRKNIPVRLDHVGALLANHDGGRVGVTTGDQRHYGGVHHPKAGHSADPGGRERGSDGKGTKIIPEGMGMRLSRGMKLCGGEGKEA